MTFSSNLISVSTLASSATSNTSYTLTPTKCGDYYCVNDIDFDNSDSSISKNIIITAVDEIGNLNEQSFTISRSLEVDTKAPEIKAISVLDDNDTELKDRIIPGQFVATVRIAIYENESGLDISSIIGDFSDLTASAEVANWLGPIVSSQTATPTCDYISQYWYCTFTNVQISMDQSESRVLIFNATDYSGNKVSKSYSYAFVVDATAPAATKFYSNFSSGGAYWLGKSLNSIYIDFIESGIGLYNHTVYLDTRNLNSESRLQADNCTGQWTCHFKDIDVEKAGDGNNVSVQLNMDTADDLGNEISQTYKGYFMIDLIDPAIQNLTLNSSTGYCPTANDKMLFEAYVIENGSRGVTIGVNASGITTYSNPYYETDCTADSSSDLWYCYLEISDLPSSYVNKSVDVIIMDGAGNNYTESMYVEVCEYENATASCVTTTPGVSLPSKLDQLTMSQLSVPLFIPLTLKLCTDGQIYTKSIDCSGTANLDSSTAPYLVADTTNSPYISMRVKGVVENGSSDGKLPVKCNLSMKIRKGNKVYEGLEVDSVSVNVELYNNPLGTIGDQANKTLTEYDTKITDLKTEIDKDLEEIESFIQICEIAEMLGTIDSLLQAVQSVIWGVTCVLSKTPAFPAAMKLYASTCKTLSGFHGIVKNYIWNPSFFPGTGIIGWMIKLMCTILSCRLCTTSYWQNTMISIAGAVASATIGGKGTTAEDAKVEDDTAAAKRDNEKEKSGFFGSLFGGSGDVDVDDGGPAETSEQTKAQIIAPGKEGKQTVITVQVDTGAVNYVRQGTSDTYTADIDTRNAASYSSNDLSVMCKSSSCSVYPSRWGRASSSWASSGDYSSMDLPDSDDIDPTDIDMDPSDTGWIMNPYKSIHYAKGCHCIPGEIYNKRKERQVYCIARDCIKSTATVGLPIYTCQQQLKENMCLYVEGASYLMNGDDDLWANLFDNLFDIITSDMIALALGVIGIACDITYSNQGTVFAACAAGSLEVCSQGGWNTVCAVTAALQGILTIKDTLENGIDTDAYETELTGTDYC